MRTSKPSASVALKEYTIIEQIEIASGVFVLGVQRPFDFTPGQWVQLSSDTSIPPRMYSICSGNQDKDLRILYNVKSDGLLTPQLARRKAGDSIYLSSPAGTFYPRPQNSWWIASGTGIAPFISQILSETLHTVHLIQGARTQEGFYFQKLLETQPGLHYTRCCSGESHPHLYAGRLTKFLKEYPQLPTDALYSLCGSPEMVVDTRDLLIARGVPYSNIASEIYF